MISFLKRLKSVTKCKIQEETNMEELQMFTQEEVAKLLHTHVQTVTMLREVGILPATKTGRNYMITKDAIKDFQVNYVGLDVSNRVKAIEARKIVNNRLAAI